MKILKILLFGLVGLLILLVIVGFLMPQEWQAKRSIVIRAKPEAIHAHIADFERWPEWMPWIAEDPQMAITFEGQRGAVGSVMRWRSEKLGDGVLTLIKSSPLTGMQYELMMKEFDQPAHGSIDLVAEGDGTRVTWTDEGKVGANPIMRLSVPLLEAMLGTYFDRGLATLKRNVEKAS